MKDLMKFAVILKAVKNLFYSTKGNINITALQFVSRRVIHNQMFNKDVEVIEALADGFNHISLNTFHAKTVYISRFYNLPEDDKVTDRRFKITFH